MKSQNTNSSTNTVNLKFINLNDEEITFISGGLAIKQTGGVTVFGKHDYGSGMSYVVGYWGYGNLVCK